MHPFSFQHYHDACTQAFYQYYESEPVDSLSSCYTGREQKYIDLYKKVGKSAEGDR